MHLYEAFQEKTDGTVKEGRLQPVTFVLDA